MRYYLFIIALLLIAAPATALVIDRDVVWQGDKSFSEDVRVMPGATLTVMPGTKIFFSRGQLEVTGNIVATDVEFSGERWDGILLKGNDSQSVLEGCLIKGAKTGIQVKGGAPVLKELQLTGNKFGVELRGRAAGTLVRSTFTDNEKVGLFVKDDSTTAVSACRFEKNGRYGAYLYRAKPSRFSGNVFVENGVALMIAYHGSDPVIDENEFRQNDVAIQVDRAARPTIKDNLLLENRTGLYAYRRSDPVVKGNLFKTNDIGVLVAYSSYPLIEGNDFVANELALKLEYQSSAWEEERGASTRANETVARSAFAGQGMRSVTEADRRASRLDGMVAAAGNWWGKQGLGELEQEGVSGNPSFIHDGRDQATFVDAGSEYPLDKVVFHPWSQAPLTGSAQ